MFRRLVAGAGAALTVVLVTMPGMASGAQAGDQALVRVAHFAPGLLKGDVYVIHVNGRLQLKGVPGRRFALLLLIAGGLVAATGHVVQQRRSSG